LLMAVVVLIIVELIVYLGSVLRDIVELHVLIHMMEASVLMMVVMNGMLMESVL